MHSDYRLKTNVVTLINQLERIRRLRPVSFNYVMGGQPSEGFLAHELQEVFQECVYGDKDAVDNEGRPVWQGVHVHFSLVASIVSCLKELDATLSTLSNAVSELKTDLTSLRGEYRQLTNT